MRLIHVEQKDQVVDVLLKRGSLYIMRQVKYFSFLSYFSHHHFPQSIKYSCLEYLHILILICVFLLGVLIITRSSVKYPEFWKKNVAKKKGDSSEACVNVTKLNCPTSSDREACLSQINAMIKRNKIM